MNRLDLGDPHEPYDFTELVRRNPGWADDFIDTIPTAPVSVECDDDTEVFLGLKWALVLTAATVVLLLAL